MSIRIGANPIGWSNDDMLELGGNIPLEQCLTEAKAAGFEGMELGNKFPRDAAKLKPILDAHGLDLVSGWYSCELLNRDADAEMTAMRPHLDLLKAMGCKVVIVAETSNAIHGDRAKPLSERPVLESGRWETFGARMTELAEKTLNEGLRLVYHHHMGTIVQSFEDINAFMAATGEAVHLLFDTGHARWGGSVPAAIASMHKARISHIHCKDLRGDVAARAASENMSFLDAVVEGVYTVPGDGGIDFVSALKPLAGYSGWVVVEAEQDPEKAHPATYAKMGHDNLSRYLREAGLM